MKILVTGGAGFIGGNFVHYMVNKYPEDMIVNLDKLTYAGNLETCKPVEGKPNYKFVKGDIADREFIFDLFKKEKFDVVVNFAAESHVDNSIKNPFIFTHTNVIGTHTLLETAKQKWGEGSENKFVHISTDEVYGALGEDGYFTEKSPIQPSSPYSASKASSDLIALAYKETFKMNVNVNEMDRTTDVWLTQSEAGSELVGMMLKDIYSGCKQKNYDVTVFISGTKKPADTTVALVMSHLSPVMPS